MKIPSAKVAELIRAVRAHVPAEERESANQLLTIYYLDDLTVSFTQGDKPAFRGLTFEALGRDFYVLTNLDLLVTGENDEGDEEPYLVEDAELAAMLGELLAWRSRVLENFHV